MAVNYGYLRVCLFYYLKTMVKLWPRLEWIYFRLILRSCIIVAFTSYKLNIITKILVYSPKVKLKISC